MSGELHYEILPESQKKLWDFFISQSKLLDQFEFYLAGGTALALQLGHRQSLDFDFFSQKSGFAEQLCECLKKYGTIIVREMDDKTLHVDVQGVKISFIGGYQYGTINPCVNADGLKLASLMDIGLMKLLAIIHRATVRDYLDLAVIIHDSIDLNKLLAPAKQKYGETFNSFLCLKALVSYHDLDGEFPVLFDATIKKSWQQILQEAVKNVSLGQ